MSYKDKARKALYQKEYWKKYSEKNKEKIKEKNKKYNALLKDSGTSAYKKFGRSWYERNKQRNLERGRKWHQENKERSVEIVQKYVKNNKEKVTNYNREFSQSAPGKYRYIQYRHAKRWPDTRVISLEEFINICREDCDYCGEEARMGIDRMNNEQGYTLENSVACCKTCNFMKKVMSKEQFLNHIEKVYNYNKK